MDESVIFNVTINMIGIKCAILLRVFYFLIYSLLLCPLYQYSFLTKYFHNFILSLLADIGQKR